MAVPSPWHQLTPAELDHPGHDPRTCKICAPFYTEAAARGAAAAHEDATRAEATR